LDLASPEIWISLLTLTVLEIVLGIDNIVFISILTGKLPPALRKRGRNIGLGLAMLMRILLLLSISVIIKLTDPILDIAGEELSGRDLILIGGGLFLLAKSTYEIHEKLEAREGHANIGGAPSFTSVIVQILILDLVFSLDSVITAVGTADHVEVMIAAVIIAVGVMLVSAGPISSFVEEHPTVKILALSFLLLIGMSLVAEGLDQHISKGYIYFAMGFSIFVEFLNIRLRTKDAPPVHLRQGYTESEVPPAAPTGTASAGG
jgi:predicted tellurium resistance membrane protein TerC